MVLSEGSVDENKVRHAPRRFDVHDFGLQVVFSGANAPRLRGTVPARCVATRSAPNPGLSSRSGCSSACAFKYGLWVQHFLHSNAVQAFQKRNHVPVRHPHHLVNFCQRSHAVQIRAGRHLNPRIELRHNAQNLLRAFQRVEQRQRAFTPHGQRHHGSRKQNRISNRKYRKASCSGPYYFTHP